MQTIIARLMGGLGNQMFQYAANWVWSKELGAQLKIDLSFLKQRDGFGKDFVFRGLALDIFNLEFEFLETAKEEFCNIKQLQLSHKHLTEKIDNLSYQPNLKFKLEELFKESSSVVTQGYWASPNYFHNYQQEIKQLFNLDQHLTEPHIRKLYSEIKQNDTVAINIRRQEFVDNRNHGWFGREYVLKALKLLEAEGVMPSNIYLISDDLEWCEKNLNDLDAKVITPDYYGRDYAALLKLFSAANHKIIPNSTFAWWAAYLSETDGITVAPAWMTQRCSVKDYIPNYLGWKLLEEPANFLQVESKPKIAVIISCYNYGKYLNDAIASVDNQLLKPAEVIIVDDGSTEKDTLDALELIRQTRPEIKLIQTANQGVAAARNLGISHSTAEYIVCLDADDKLHPEYLASCANEFINADSNLGFVTTWVQNFEERENVWQIEQQDPLGFYIQNLAHVASMFSKDAWENASGYLVKFDGYEDWCFWLSILAKGYKYRVIKKPLILYRNHKGSKIHQSDGKRDKLYRLILDKFQHEISSNACGILAEAQALLKNIIEGSNQRIVSLEDRIKGNDKMIDEKNEYIRKLEGLVLEHKEVIHKTEKLVEEFKAAFQSTERLVAERDEYIKVLEGKLSNVGVG